MSGFGSFVYGDETFVGAIGRAVLVQEYEGERPYLDLEIVIESSGASTMTPRLVVDHLRVVATDWAALEGTTLAIPDPGAEDEQDQNVFWGPDFENVLSLELVFGKIDGDVITLTVRGVAMHPTENEDVEDAIPFAVEAGCALESPPPRRVAAVPPAGPKTCRICKVVSSDLVERCLSCDAPGWWKPG